MALEAAGINWTAWIALCVSFVTLGKSFWSDTRAKRDRRASTFERDYGSAVRTELRSFNKKLSALKAFTYKSGKPLKRAKAELEKLRGDWLTGAEDLCSVLVEVDQAVDLLDAGWEEAFRAHAERAEVVLGEVAGEAVDSEDDLIVAAVQGLAHYRDGVKEVRQKLLEQEEHLSSVRLRKLL